MCCSYLKDHTATAVSEALQAHFAFDLDCLVSWSSWLSWPPWLLLPSASSLLRVLRILLVGCFRVGLATADLATGASSAVLAYARTTALLAAGTSSVVLAYARSKALLAL